MKNLIQSMLLLAAMVLVSVFGVACDTATESEVTGNLPGVVREQGSGTPLADITVALGNLQTTTDNDGRFEFRDVPVGVRTLEVSTPGFDLFTTEVNVQEGDNSHDISLVRKTYYESRVGVGDDYGLYLPPGFSTYRGVIFLVPAQAFDTRGFASGIDRDTPIHPDGFNEIIEARRVTSLLLAEKYGLALMGADVSTLEARSLVLGVLDQFAVESGHPELAQAPLLVTGFSFGGGFTYEFTLDHPDRVIGFMPEHGGCCMSTQDPGPALLVPGYLFLGENDGLTQNRVITGIFEENRPLGALWALAARPFVGHEPVQDQALVFNWMDAVLNARLPETVTPGSPVILRPIDETSGWLGNQESSDIADYAGYAEDKLQASWLPSMQTAVDWKAITSE